MYYSGTLVIEIREKKVHYIPAFTERVSLVCCLLKDPLAHRVTLVSRALALVQSERVAARVAPRISKALPTHFWRRPPERGLYACLLTRLLLGPFSLGPRASFRRWLHFNYRTAARLVCVGRGLDFKGGIGL